MKLKDFFQTVAEQEILVERQRQSLARHPDFEPFAAFTRFDRETRSRVGSLEIYRFLTDNNVNYITLGDIDLLVSYFDSDRDGVLTYSEFMQILLPCEDQYLRGTASQRPTYNVSRFDRLAPSLEREVVALLEREINFHVRVEKNKRDLALRYDWTGRAGFETVDSLREYVLNHRNIQSFLRLNGFIATDGEVISIIRRIDSDGDNRVTLDEFLDALRPAIPLPSSVPSSTLAAYEESKRASSPLRRTAASPLRQTEVGAGLSHSSASLGGAFGASHGSPSRTSTYVPAMTSSMSPSRRYSPMKADDENELVRAFKEQIALENELEDAKNRLALQPDFNVPDAFDLLDRHHLGSLTATELSDSLASNGIYAVSEDVFLFVKRYDRNQDSRLSYGEV